MSTRKTIRDNAPERAARKKPLQDVELTVWPAPKVEATNLELVTDDDPGCDPYNSTGEFCLEQLRRFDD